MSIENGKISLPLAEQYTTGWMKRQAIATTELRAFTVRRTELEFLLFQMTISQCDAARFYLGDKADEDNPAFQPCLVMVGVQGFVPEIEMVSKVPTFPPGSKPPTIPGTEKYFTYFRNDITIHTPHDIPTPEEPYVLDFAYPCPHTCNIGDLWFNTLPAGYTTNGEE